MDKRYLFLMDIDGTLIDEQYQANSATIYPLIRQMQEAGHIFVLNSNRALEDIQMTAEKFFITGPSIIENGCAIYFPEKKSFLKIVNDENIIQINMLKRWLKEVTNNIFPSSLYLIDNTRNLKYSELLSNMDDATIFVENQFRLYSISLHVRKIKHGSMVKNFEDLKKIYSIAKDYIEKQRLNLKIYFTERYSNLIINSFDQDKSQAIDILADYYPEYSKIVIGDDYSDKANAQKVDYFFVVRNASNEAKNIADYIAENDLTRGVEEILLNINNLTIKK